MRFRRRTKILPGVYLNFSKSGISTTVGIPGASVNFGQNGTYLNTGIPGTGLYNRQRIDTPQGQRRRVSTNSATYQTPENWNDASNLTSIGLQDLKDCIFECLQEKEEIFNEIKKKERSLLLLKIANVISKALIFGLIFSYFKKSVEETKKYITDLKYDLSNCKINIDININPSIENAFTTLTRYFVDATSCSKIWDVTSYELENRQLTRSSAEMSIKRKEIKLNKKENSAIKSKFEALHLENANGGDLFFYPAFLYCYDNINSFSIIDIREIEVSLVCQQFLEEDSVPADSNIKKYAWYKSNADGSQDKRFKNNFQIPICEYGRIDITSKSGLKESFLFSNFSKASNFANALHAFIQQAKISQ